MSASPVPAGFHTLTPSLTVRDASAAIEFYRKAFGAVELYRLPSPDGKIMHAEIRIGDSPVMLSDEFPEWGAIAPEIGKGASYMLYVPECDALFHQAVAAGATVVRPPSDMFWGDRCGCLNDPYGYRWSIATHQRDLTYEEIAEAAKSFGGCSGEDQK